MDSDTATPARDSNEIAPLLFDYILSPGHPWGVLQSVTILAL